MTTRKIALEEAITTPPTKDYLPITLKVAPSQEAADALTQALENSDQRIAAMDDAGIDLFVLSQTSPGVQAEKDAGVAVERARETNDFMQAQIKQYPDRYRGFAHLAMHDVRAAGDELRRCVEEFGFLGPMINGNTNGIYLDDERYFPFWERVLELNVPVYIHPADPHMQPWVLNDYFVLQGTISGWTTDNSSHFLRLLFSGLFDRYPDLTIILGHMGETLPYVAWRIDSRYAAQGDPDRPPLKKKPSEYFRSNLIITTTGMCQDSSLLCAVTEVGVDRVLFSVDYPFEEATQAADWIENTPALTDQTQRDKVCYQNAERVLRLASPT
ncbi:MAG TPA: amidohydrolase family protein [Pyrinomonadaceae bacterium]|jgi:2,3-dihydroxybenzoate decarboxylase